MVVYQVYPRSFADADGDGVGDLAGIIERLEHLAYLGVDALWLSPIYPSPLADGGYDISDHAGVDPRLGTPSDVDRLAARCHELGLKLLLDVVPCHTSIEHPWFAAHPERYVIVEGEQPPNNWRSSFGGPAWSADPHGRGVYLHAFYPEQPDLDWREPSVPAAFAEILSGWRRRGVDGFRLDALQSLAKDPQLADDGEATSPPAPGADLAEPCWQLDHSHSADWEDTPAALAHLRAGAGEDAYLVGEVHLFAERVQRYLEHLDAAFCFELLLADPWDAPTVCAAVAAGLTLERPAWVLSNHDFPRLPTRLGAARARGAALLLAFLPGDVFLFQGDELDLADGPGMWPGEPPDDRHGRDPHRHPMPWTPEEAAHGFSTAERPWLPVVAPAHGSVQEQRGAPASPLEQTRALLALRRRLRGPLEDLRADGELVVARRGAHHVCVNCSETPAAVPAALRDAPVLVATDAPRGGVIGGGAGVVTGPSPAI